MIPPVDRTAIGNALEQFDRELRDSAEFADWEDNSSYKYALAYLGRRYPVKQIISLATNTPVSAFSGGEGEGQANNYVRDRGFEVIELRKRNPKWTRDELILALDFYLQHGPNPPGKDSAEIRELSSTLNHMARVLGISRESTFRNTNGVYMKLMNFRRFDSEFADQGKVGLSRGGKEEELVWNDFAGSPQRCHDVAKAIRAGLMTVGDSVIDNPTARDEDELEDAPEGRLLTVTHLRRERNRALIEKKKAQVIKQLGRLVCEACGFDFSDRYGIRGVGFIECHHTRPLATLAEDGGRTALGDLALLCANCHRMVHAKRPWLSVSELRSLIAASRTD